MQDPQQTYHFLFRKQLSYLHPLRSQDMGSLLPRFSENQARLTTNLVELCLGLLTTEATSSAQIPKVQPSLLWLNYQVFKKQTCLIACLLIWLPRIAWNICFHQRLAAKVFSMELRRGKGHGLPLPGLSLSLMAFTLPAQPQSKPRHCESLSRLCCPLK